MTTRISAGILLVLFLGCIPAAIPGSEPSIIASTSLPDGTNIYINTITEPPSSSMLSPGTRNRGFGFRIMKQSVDIFFIDNRNDMYFGYEVGIEKIESTRQFRVLIGPLRSTQDELDLEKGRTWTLVSTTGYPPPQIISDQDTIAFDLFVNPRTQQKIIQEITISSVYLPYLSTGSQETARDYTLEDVKLKLVNPAFLINGKPMQTGKTTISGRMLWFHIPGRGRYFLSIVPRKGYAFEKTGLIEGNQLSVNLDGEKIQVRSDEPILDIYGTWNLYMLHQPSPKWIEGRYATGSAYEVE